ncbi:hypothetical protein MGM_01553 [Candida albicans P75063]|nr:hypothetical protein MGM_01553 [Candida albicans P75063]
MQVSKSYARPHLSSYKASRVNLVKNKRNYYAFHADTDLRQRNFIRTEHSHRSHTIEAFFFLNCAFFSIEQELRKRQTIKFNYFVHLVTKLVLFFVVMVRVNPKSLFITTPHA